MRRWQSGWLPLLKPVAALAGDTVCVQQGGLWINGRWYDPLPQQAGGQPLPHLAEGCHRVPPGAVFLASTAPAVWTVDTLALRRSPR